MSNLKYTLELSAEAYDDLVDIQNYTFTTHGETQLNKYEELLDKAMIHILEYPLSGHTRDDVPKGYLTWNVGEHVIIYRGVEAGPLCLSELDSLSFLRF